MIAIIDYQAGNQTSVKRALDALNIKSCISSKTEELLNAQGVIFPGVGAAGQAMKALKKNKLDLTIKEIVQSGVPFLGICLGCQIMLEKSAENNTETLGLLEGESLPFDPCWKNGLGEKIKVPHMGWNNVEIKRNSPIFHGLKGNDQFYFVHGYYPGTCDDYVLGTTKYGVEFPSVFGRDGLWAIQFHPEKSGLAGLHILENFYSYCKK